jgi:hypothetical protein
MNDLVKMHRINSVKIIGTFWFGGLLHFVLRIIFMAYKNVMLSCNCRHRFVLCAAVAFLCSENFM